MDNDEKRETKPVTVWIYKDQDEFITEEAKRQRRSKAFILREAIDSFRRWVMGEEEGEDERKQR